MRRNSRRRNDSSIPGKIVEIDAIVDPDRVRRLATAVL